ncbi:unnamed protein product [Rhodiola kirilowii]
MLRVGLCCRGLATYSNVTSSSDSDTDSYSDSDEQQNLQLQTLEQDLSTNPSNYDAHIQYIKLLRRMGLIEKLRSARELMSSLFPLSPDLWQEWSKDEISLVTGPEAFSRIEKLYEKGISDYQSNVRNLFKRSLTATGQRKTDSAHSKHNPSTVISVPLADSHSTFKTYKAWEVTSIDASSSSLDGMVASAYQKALQMYNARAPFEEKDISENDISDPERLQNFMNYLKFELSSELTLWKDLDAARTVWESLINKTSGSMLAAWLGYIAMEVGQGNINKARRSLYRGCYSRRFTETGSEEICASWLRFEREYSTQLEDFDHAALKVAPRLEELRLFKLQQD